MSTKTMQVTETDLSKLLEESREYDNLKADFQDAADAFSFLEQKYDEAGAPAHDPALVGGMVVPSDGKYSLPPFQLTDWAMGQLCGKLGKSVGLSTLPKNYLTALPAEVRASLLNYHTAGTDGKWNVRTYGDTVRAVVSDKFSEIMSNTDLLEMLVRIDEEGAANGLPQPGRVTRSSVVTPDDLNVRVVWKHIENGKGNRNGNNPGGWGIGVYVGNGEIGNKRLRVRPLLWRTSCDNSIIGNSDEGGEVTLTHIGNPVAKRVAVKSAILNALPFAARLLETMIAAEETKLPNITDVIYALEQEYGWSEDIKSAVFAGTENKQTHAGLVNGITYAAHTIKDPIERAEFEMFGGAILVDEKSVFSRALRNAREIERVR